MNELALQSDRSLQPPPIPHDATEDDGAVLRAVHAFLLDDDVIGALDSDDDKKTVVTLSGESSSAHDSSGSATETPTRKAATKYPPARPRMVNRSRVRMQNEIFSLRQKSIALERRLAELQSDGSGAASATSDSPTGTAAASTSWQMKALEQRERVEAAEREREKLRKKVTDCRQAVKRVRQFLRRRTQKQSTMTKTIRPNTSSCVFALDLDATIGHEDLSQYLDSMYAQLESVFQDEELDSVTRVTDELNKMRIKNDESPNMSIEYVKSRVLPFNVDTTAKAVWAFHATKTPGVAQVQDGSQDTDDMLRGSVVSTVSFPHFKGYVRGRWEARRFVGNDRIIILHCSSYQRFEGADEAIDGFGVRILNWTVISPPRHEHLRTASGRSVSHVDSFEVAMPFMAGDATRYFTPKELEVQKAFLLRSIEYTHEYERQVIENILVSSSK